MTNDYLCPHNVYLVPCLECDMDTLSDQNKLLVEALEDVKAELRKGADTGTSAIRIVDRMWSVAHKALKANE